MVITGSDISKGPSPTQVQAALRSKPDQLRHFSPVNRPRSEACEGRCWEALEPPLVTAEDHREAKQRSSQPMSVWLERSLAPEAEQDALLAEKEATTLYLAIKATREELEQAGSTWRPRLADYEGAAVRYLDGLRESGKIGSTAALAVVMVFGNGFRVYEYDGARMHLRTDIKNVRVDFYGSLANRDYSKYYRGRVVH
ncbi:hypothetical protein PG985_012996 [Apiospora marii]|uniref:Uncharacterized protein n=1 Tax=Apiospora marii TaxID=335849 RepID=A0ABR1RC10_9PEZI